MGAIKSPQIKQKGYRKMKNVKVLEFLSRFGSQINELYIKAWDNKQERYYTVAQEQLTDKDIIDELNLNFKNGYCEVDIWLK